MPDQSIARTGPRPIDLAHLRMWAARTLRFDRRHYRAAPEPLSLGRVTRSLFPALRRPLFIIGTPRSGTTFLGRCVAALPGVSYHHEPVATRAATRYVYEGLWSFAFARRFYRAVYAWLARVHLAGHRRFVEKTPRNALIIPFLARAFPGAQFLHILRDGRDVACSLREKPWLSARMDGSGLFGIDGYPQGSSPRFWVEPHRRAEFASTTDLHRALWCWRRYTERALRDGPRLGPGRYLRIRYARLVREPEEVAGRVLDFLGVTAPAAREAFRAVARTASDASLGRWQVLTPAERALVEREAGELLGMLFG